MTKKDMLDINFEARMLDNLLESQMAFLEASRRFALLTDIYERLTVSPDMLDEGDIEYLMLFENPLGIIADCMEDRMNDFADLDIVLAEVFDDDELAERYALAASTEGE